MGLACGQGCTGTVERTAGRHLKVLREVVPGFEEAEAWVLESFEELEELLGGTPTDKADQDYDQVVCFR